MMKKVILLCLLVCVPAGMIFSQTNESKKAAVQVSFIPPLSTQGMQASQYTNATAFNMLAGVSKNVTAFSLSGLGNVVLNDIEGFHISGLGTYAGNDGKGVMIGGLFNATKGNFSGFQMGGIVNWAKEMKGFQMGGIANLAEDVHGFQFAGVVNIAKRVRGVQFAGVLNVAEHSDYPIGIVNIIKDGEMSIGVAYNEIGSTVLSFRSGGRVLYGIVGVGYNHKLVDEDFVMEAGFGGHINISSRFRINNELKSVFTTFTGDENTMHASFSIMPAFKVMPRWEIFAGPSVNYLNTDNVGNEKMFTSHNIWRKFSVSRLQQVNLGFSVGTHFLF